MKTLLIGLMTLAIPLQTLCSLQILPSWLFDETYYYPTGEKSKTVEFDNLSSDSHWVTNFNINGEITKKTNYYSDDFVGNDGTRYIYESSMSSRVKEVVEYVDGELSKSTWYYETGEVEQVNEYVNGKISKVTAYYNYKTGEVKRVDEYADWEISKSTHYYETGEIERIEEFADMIRVPVSYTYFTYEVPFSRPPPGTNYLLSKTTWYYKTGRIKRVEEYC